MRFTAALGAVGALFSLITGAAFATPPVVIPVDGQLGLQPAATPVMENIHEFHTLLVWIITAISVFVLALLGWAMIRYRARPGHEPKKFSHNTFVEVVWTVVPILILVVIAVPSFRLLYFQDVIPEADFTIKTTGNQWNWTYEYPDHGGFQYVANMIADEDVATWPYEAHRLLTTDLPVVVPVGATVRVEVTASDVIHNWAMPAFGIKMDAIPGRLNETWFVVDEPGVFYGQCSELCGLRHAFMPIEVHVVPQEVFDAWVAAANEDPYEAPRVLAAHYDELRGESRVASAR
ncbi:MAG: cytochrome c oxidase subunit II [Oceanicaulis sp.]